MGYPCPASPEDQVEVAAETKSPFQLPNFLHEDLRISGLMLRARGRTLFFSSLLGLVRCSGTRRLTLSSCPGTRPGASKLARVRAWPPFAGGSVLQLSYRAKILLLNGKGTKCTFGFNRTRDSGDSVEHPETFRRLKYYIAKEGAVD